MNRWLLFAVGVALLAPAGGRVASAQDVVAKVEPACSNVRSEAKTRQWITDMITVSYDARAKDAGLRGATAVTMRLAMVGWQPGVPGPTKDIAMTRGADGVWRTSFTLAGREVGEGYGMVEFEDQAHRVDNNRSRYWDLMLCRAGEPLRISAEASTYEGREIAPGFQRAPDLPKGLAIMREDYAQRTDFNDLFLIWMYERRIGNDSAAAFQQISRELSEQLDKWGTYTAMLHSVVGFVAAVQDKLDPAVMAKYRAAVLAMPNDPPMQYGAGGKLQPVARTKRWDEGVAREMQEILAELDFWPIEKIADSTAKAAANEEYARKYGECRECSRVAPAYISAFEIYADRGDLDDAARVEREWAFWDPKNPDALASLAAAYLKANVSLADAERLVDEAGNLYEPFSGGPDFQKIFSENIRAQMYDTIAPFPQSKAEIPILRGKIEGARGEWEDAARDLELGCSEKPDDGDAQEALGTALEHTGDQQAALAAYLKAASAPYQTSAKPEEDYRRMFVAMHRGTAAEAEASLSAAIEANRRAVAEQYVPVELHREMPAMKLASLSGRPLAHPLPAREPAVVNFWSVWCLPCVAELPALLSFQKSHPGVSVLAIAVSDKPSDVAELLKKKHLDGLHVAVTGTVPADFGGGFPTTAVLSPAGELEFLHEGAPADLAAVLQKDLAALGR